MRILLPVDRIDDAGIGTVTRGLCRLLPQVLEPEDRLITVGGRPPCNTGPRVTHLLTRRPPVNRGARFFHEQAVLARAAEKADLLHLSDMRSVLASPLPFVVTFHDLFFLDQPTWYPPVVRRYKELTLAATVAKKPAAIVCVSEFTRERALARFPDLDRDTVHVVRPGVEPEDAPREDDDGAEDYFLTISTIEPRKNHLTLLEAFQRARAAGLKLRWRVAGGPGYASGKIIQELASADGVDLLGRVSDGERELLYRRAAFVAHPSYAEGFGFPALEAMARGVPCACGQEGAMGETAGDAVFAVPPADIEAWKDALLTLAEDSGARDQLRAAGREQVSRFDPLESARRYGEIYRRACA